jgi:hypothetical protein
MHYNGCSHHHHLLLLPAPLGWNKLRGQCFVSKPLRPTRSHERLDTVLHHGFTRRTSRPRHPTSFDCSDPRIIPGVYLASTFLFLKEVMIPSIVFFFIIFALALRSVRRPSVAIYPHLLCRFMTKPLYDIRI